MSQRFYYKSNRLQQLRGFCRVVEVGSISRAATMLKLSQASVSIQIKSLEENLQCELFERTGKRLKLTANGQLLYDLAQESVETLDGIGERFLLEKSTRQNQLLSVAANSTTLNFLLPKILAPFLQTDDLLSVTVHYAEHAEAIEKLLAREVELALLPRREHKPFPASIRYEPIFTFHPALITRKDHPLCGKRRLKMSEIAKYDLSLPDEELRVIPNLYEALPKKPTRKGLRIQFVNWETTRKFIEAGLVISISSDVILSKHDVLKGTSLSHLFPSVDYGFIMARGTAPSVRARQLIDQAKVIARRMDRSAPGV